MIKMESNNKLGFLLIAILMTFSTWYIAAQVFPSIQEVDNLFGIVLSTEAVFNKSLFIQMTVCNMGLFIMLLVTKRTPSVYRLLYCLLLYCGITCYVLGINLPLIATTRFWIFEEQRSLLQILSRLKSGNEPLLFSIMLAFTFVIPVLKFLALVIQAIFTMPKWLASIMSVISKWAMVDVLVIAILVVGLKTSSGMVTIDSRNGLIYFTMSILVTMALTFFAPKMRERSTDQKVYQVH